MSARPGRSGALLALALFATAAAVIGSRVGLPVLSHDDIYRTLYAHDWSRRPYFFTERLVWLPFPLIAAGVAMRVTGEALWTALAVDVAATGVALWYVHRIAARRFGRLAAWVAATLLGLTPWVLFLALSRYGEPVLLAATALGVFHWLRWAEGGAGHDLARAALALSAAVLTRYEAWPLGVALPVHVALAQLTASRPHAFPLPVRRPGWVALWSGLPLVGMGIWVWKNLSVYGEPVYGGAFGFLPSGAPAGALGGARLAAQYLWQLNPMLAGLGLLGLALHGRRAPGLVGLIGLGAIVPWYTVSLLPVEVALQVRLMVVPLAVVAPFAGAFVARTLRPRGLALGVALAVVAAQLAVALRAEYPGTRLPMVLLARSLHRDGALDRFDALYVRNPRLSGYPDEVRVATNFSRPVLELAPDPAAAPWRGTSAEAILVLDDGPPPAGLGEAFEVARVPGAVAWGLCNRDPDERVRWVDLRAPRTAQTGEPVTVEVTLENAGRRAWRPPACGVILAHRWLDPGGRIVGEVVRSPVARGVEPAGTVSVALAAVAPGAAGPHTLEIDLLGRPSAAFGARGGTARVAIEVRSAGP